MTTEQQLERLYAEFGTLRCDADVSEVLVEVALVDEEFYSIIVTYVLRSLDGFQKCDAPTAAAIRRAGFDWEFDGTEVGPCSPPFYRGLFFYVPGRRGRALEAVRDGDPSRGRRIAKTFKVSQRRSNLVHGEQLREDVRVRRRTVH